MAALSFMLECVAVAALIGTVTSLLVVGSWLTVRPLVARAGPSARAEVAFVLGLLPALAAIGATIAAALPPLLSAVGLAADHCPSHLHHLHLCITHSGGIRPALAAIGSLSLASFVARAGWFGYSQLQLRRTLAGLLRLASSSDSSRPVVQIPGAPRFCHAVGLFRGRILLSVGLLERLPSDQLRSALAHERAHLLRRDPLANLLLSMAGLFQPPGLSAILSRAYRNAAEEACDDHAASLVGDGSLVAEALVAVAAIQRGAALGEAAPAFGEQLLENRVRRLLSGSLSKPRGSLALKIGGIAASIVLLSALVQAPFLHHAVETVLHQLF